MIDAGTPAPAFTLPDQDGTPVSLSDFAGLGLCPRCFLLRGELRCK